MFDRRPYGRVEFFPDKHEPGPGAVLVSEKECWFGLLSLGGQVIVEHLRMEAKRPWDARDEVDRHPAFRLRDGLVRSCSNGRCGLRDLGAKLVVPAEYEDVRGFSEGVAAVRLEGRWGFIDRERKVVIAPRLEAVSARGFDGGQCLAKEGGRWGITDRTGAFVKPPAWDDVRQEGFSEGLLGVKVGARWGFTDRQANLAVAPQFDSVKEFSEGYAVFGMPPRANRHGWFDVKHGCVDARGKVRIKPQFLHAEAFKGGRAFVVRARSDGRDPFPIDRNGREIQHPGTYAQGQCTEDGVCAMETWTDPPGLLYDVNARREIGGRRFAAVEPFVHGRLAWVLLSKTDDEYAWGWMNREGTLVATGTEQRSLRPRRMSDLEQADP